jgi:hypothetical protein
MNEATEQSRLQALVLKENVKLPSPFAPEIADVSIRSPSNSLDDGYALRMTVSFGTDEIRLETESHLIIAEMSLKQARIELEFVGCNPSFSDLYSEKLENEQTEITEKQTSTTAGRVNHSGSLGGSLNISPPNSITGSMKASAALSGEDSVEVVKERSSTQTHSGFRHTSIANVVVGDNQNSDALKGTVVGDYEGWRVFPKTEGRSGVLASLKVKQNWIDFKKVTTEKKKNAQTKSSKLEKWFSMVSLGTAEKQDLFETLIKNLVYFKLQRPAEKNYATLSCSVLVVEPETGDFLAKPSQVEVIEFSIRDQLFEDFISAENETKARQIAENPYSYMLPKPIYEFPQCSPAEMLHRLDVRKPKGLMEAPRSWEQETIRVATDQDIDEDILFLKVPSNWSPYGGRKIDPALGDPLKTIALHAERVPVLSAAIQEAGLFKFASMDNSRQANPLRSFVGRIVGNHEKESDSRKEFVRRHLDDYFSKVYKNRMSDKKVNHKITLASLWVEFILDCR